MDNPKNTTEEKPKRPINPNREKLLLLSANARAFKERMINESTTANDALYWEAQTLNSIMLKYFYKVPEGMELGTFNQWKSQNCMVKKGEKALVIWGQPLRAQRANEAQAKGEQAPEDDASGEYFPMCFLFRADQVLTPEQIESKKQTKQEKREKKLQIAAAIATVATVNLDAIL